uniref:Uncharacterized protein n=1 Tax=Anguilla anguilla TaxID=7936 RepID=A0A0E9XX49_ANGAN
MAVYVGQDSGSDEHASKNTQQGGIRCQGTLAPTAGSTVSENSQDQQDDSQCNEHCHSNDKLLCVEINVEESLCL